MSEGQPDIFVRFEGLDGECMDEFHPGKKVSGAEYPKHPVTGKEVEQGWFAIKSFGWNFSVKDADGTATDDTSDAAADGGQNQQGSSPNTRNAGANSAAKRRAKSKSKTAAKEDTGPHTHPDVKLTKTLDRASAVIWSTKCYQGQVITKVELEACRTGGIPGAPKIPFVHITFAGVYIKGVDLSISEDALPSETITFSYEKVKMASIWTDNKTGERCIDNPRRFGWDFKGNKQWKGDT